MRSLKDPLVRQAITIALAVGAFGVSFGVISSDAGLSLGKAMALSGLVYGGSAQLAAVGVVAEGGTALAAVLGGLLLSARTVAFGVALAPILTGGVGRRLLASQLVIDQSAGVALAEADPARARRAFWLTGVAVLVLWLAGTALGWALTGAIDLEALGLDAAIPAVFVALLAPRMRRPSQRAAALAGAVIALALTPFVPAGLPILAAALGAGAGMIVLARRPEEP